MKFVDILSAIRQYVVEWSAVLSTLYLMDTNMGIHMVDGGLYVFRQVMEAETKILPSYFLCTDAQLPQLPSNCRGDMESNEE